VLEDSARDEAMLECNRSFHVRPAVIDGASHRKQPVMNRAGFRVILRFAGRDEFDERFRCKAAISHQSAVYVEHRVKQIFVVAGKDLQIGTLELRDGSAVVNDRGCSILERCAAPR